MKLNTVGSNSDCDIFYLLENPSSNVRIGIHKSGNDIIFETHSHELSLTLTSTYLNSSDFSVITFAVTNEFSAEVHAKVLTGSELIYDGLMTVKGVAGPINGATKDFFLTLGANA